MAPRRATGQMALTVYTGQMFLLSAFPALLERPTVPAAALSVGTFMLVDALNGRGEKKSD